MEKEKTERKKNEEKKKKRLLRMSGESLADIHLIWLL